MSYAVLFPGQGSQFVGMCPDVRASRSDLCGDAASDVLGWNLDALVSDGPEELLTETQYAQPALFAVSFALWSEFSHAVSTPPSAAAGHSLGEYTALAASGVLDYFPGLALVSARGEAMAHAATLEASGMAALIGASETLAEAIALQRREAGGKLFVANINAPGQIVLAGGRDDIVWLAENARELGARRAVILKVSGAFHSPYMTPALEPLSTALASTSFREGRFPVFVNVTGAPTQDPRQMLEEQLTAPVRFASTLEGIAASGIDTFVHIGPGDVTAGLVKRTVPQSDVKVVSSLKDALDVARELSVH